MKARGSNGFKLAASAALFCAALACNSEPQPQPGNTAPSAAAGTSAPAAPQPTVTLPAAASTGQLVKESSAAVTVKEVRLLTPGAAPRRSLRYRFEKGQSAAFELSNEVEMADKSNGQPLDKKPAFVASVRITVTNVDANGRAEREFVIDQIRFASSVDLPAALRAQAEQGFKAATQVKLHDTIDDRGRPVSVTFLGSSSGDPRMRKFVEYMHQLATRMTPTFPEEAVGTGARWQVTSAFEEYGSRVDQTATFGLERLTPEGGTATVEVAQTAPPGPATALGMAEAADIVDLRAKGDGKVDFTTTRPASFGKLATQADMLARVKHAQANGTRERAFTFKLSVDVRPPTSAAAQKP